MTDLKELGDKVGIGSEERMIASPRGGTDGLTREILQAP